MKTQSKLLSFLLCSLFLSLYSCSSNDNEVLIETPDYDLSIESESFMLKVGESQDVSIVEGNGEYKAFLLNPEIATINITDNVISVEGKAIGQTDLIITDKNINVAKIPVSVFEFEKIRFEGDIEELTFDILLGESSQKEVQILEGNQRYTVDSADPELVNAHIKDDSSIVIQTQMGNKGGETILTIKDQSGFKRDLLVKVNTSLEAFTEDDKAKLREEEVSSSTLNLFDSTVNSERYDFTDTVDEGKNKLRVFLGGWYRSEVYITFEGDRNIGKVKNGKIYYSNFPLWSYNDSNAEVDLMDIEIIQNDKNYFKLIFSFLNDKGVLSPGYMIFVK